MTEPNYGYTETGRPITDALIEELVAEAERGYDVEALRAQRGKRNVPPGFDPEEFDEWGVNIRFRAILNELAEARGVPTKDVFDEAVRRFVELDG